VSLSLVGTPRPQNAFSVAVTSGKGGVGKTSVSINLAVALARLNRRVALLDADFTLGNVDIRLGLTPASHMGHVLDGERTVDDVMLDGPFGVDIVPSGSGLRGLDVLSEAQWKRLSLALTGVARGRDFLIVDTATGIGDSVIELIGLTDYALVVTTHEPAALVDAYAVIKLLTLANRAQQIGVLVNAVRDERQAAVVFGQLSRAADRFLGRTLRNDGFIVEDQHVRASALGHVPLADGALGGPASRCFRRLAARLATWRPIVPGPGPASPAVPGLPTGMATVPEGARCA